MQLTKEQIEKAAQAAHESFAVYLKWENLSELRKEIVRRYVIAAAPHLQYEPAPVPATAADEEMADKMVEIYLNPGDRGSISRKHTMLTILAYLRPILHAEVLGPVTDEEEPPLYSVSSNVTERVNNLLSARRAPQPKQPTPQERVTVFRGSEDFSVILDGVCRFDFCELEDAEIYAEGLRVRLEKETQQ